MPRMKLIDISKLKEQKFLIFLLIIIAAIAIIIRSVPAWIHAAWGCDFGIYLGITKTIAETKVLFPPYTGWGSSYNEFPVLYLVNAFFHWLTGLDVLIIMPKLTPIFGGLSVVIFYFVVNELTENKKIALLSCLFFAVMPFHVYQTSHASPLTLGHFFIILSLFNFIKFRKKTIFVIPLLSSSLLLIMSHHLSTYFYLISIIGIILFENVCSKNKTPSYKKDILYLYIFSGLTFIYWAFVAKTVYNNFMMSGFSFIGISIEPAFIILLFFIFITFLFTIGVKSLRKINQLIGDFYQASKSKIGKYLILPIWQINPFIKRRWPSFRSRILLFLIIISVILGTMLYFSITELFWVGFSLNFLAIIYAIPFIFAVAFGVAGFRYTWFVKNGLFIRGWIISLSISFLLMLLLDNKAIFPHRHLEYMMAPLAIIVVFGIGGIFSDPFFKKLFEKLTNKKDLYVKYISGKIKIPQKKRLISFSITLILVISLASSTYEVHKQLDQSREEITIENVNSISWIGENLDKNTSLIVSDHRLERMVEAEGFNTSEDEIIKLWTAENLSQFIDELLGIGKSYNRISHIIIDDIMKNQLVHIGPYQGVFRTLYMTNETWTAAYDKFENPPFKLVYKNESIQIDSSTEEPIHWTEIYEVNWTYIDKYLITSYFDTP